VLNKGTAHTEEERTLFDVHGLLPSVVETLELIGAASALGNFSQDASDNNNDTSLLPPIESMRDIAIHIAIKVVLQAQQDRVAPEMSKKELRERIHKRFWISEYRNYKPAKKEISNQ
jgi:malic enzyme